MNQLVEKLALMEREVAAEKGDFRLFALLLREDSPDKWDLLVSAPWLDANRSDGMAYLAKQVQSRLDTEQLLSLSRLVFIADDNPGLIAVLQAVCVQHSPGSRCATAISSAWRSSMPTLLHRTGRRRLTGETPCLHRLAPSETCG